MPTVFRVEDEDGAGPYMHTNLEWQKEVDILKHQSGPTHPPAQRDQGIDRYIRKGVECCAFKNITQLRRWFTRKQLRLMEATKGFTIIKYDAIITAVGKNQCLVSMQSMKVVI